MKIAMLGPVGVGKGTQIQRISEMLNYTRVGTGDLIRDQIEAGTELGQELEGYYERGEPVPDDVVMELARPHLLPAGAWILDGFPRTMAQVRALDEELEKRGIGLDRVIVLEGPSDEELIERITSGRRQSLATGRVYHLEYDPPPDPQEGRDPGPFVQREDDKEDALRREIESYREEADAIREYYEEKGILPVVNAEQAVPEVPEAIPDALGHPEERTPRA